MNEYEKNAGKGYKYFKGKQNADIMAHNLSIYMNAKDIGQTDHLNIKLDKNFLRFAQLIKKENLLKMGWQLSYLLEPKFIFLKKSKNVPF